MTKREAMRQTMLFQALRSLGFSDDEAQQLRRISLTLHHWAERCCNENILVRHDDNAWLVWSQLIDGKYRDHETRIPNREAGALRRLEAIMANHRALTYYHQTDPRGCALYIVKRSRLREYNQGKANPTPLDSCYSSVGLAVY